MLASITPLGERGRRARWGVTVGFYILGSVIGGVLVGSLAGAIGTPGVAVLDAISPTLPVLSLAALALVGVGLDLNVLHTRLPSTARQVHQSWLGRYRGWIYGLGFGLQLGAGGVTIVASSAVYLTYAAALLSGSLITGAMIGAMYGFFRGTTILLVMRVRSDMQLTRIESTLDRLNLPTKRIALTAQTGIALALIAATAI